MQQQTAPRGYHKGVGDVYMLTYEDFQAIRREVNGSHKMGDGIGFMCTDTVHPDYERSEPLEYPFYQHLRLDSSSNEIRLLMLKCEDTDGELTGSLKSFAFDKAPAYDALSYTWESPKIRQCIWLDGKRFNINQNLFQALRHLRSCVRRNSMNLWVNLWIDAICINQEDSSERNHQVNKMRHIYQRASCVRIWLGLGNNLSSQAFALARDLAKAVEIRREQELFNDSSRICQFAAFQVLLHREYWKRIWVIQEVNAAKEAEVMCGTDVISWKDLLVAQNTIAGNRDACWKLVMGNPHMDSFSTDIYYEGPRGLIIPEGSGLPTLFEALRWYCIKESTQPEDRIYGLVGVTTAGNDPRFILDYSRGPQQIYIDAAIYIIESTGLLDIICLMQPHPGGEWLPSWVPDWVNGTPTWPLNDWTDMFTASDNKNAVVSFISNGSILVAQGLYITRIARTGSVLALGNNDDQTLKDDDAGGISKLIAKFHEWRKLLDQNNSDNLQAFCRTFTSGGIREKLEPFLELSNDCTAETMLGLFAQLSRMTMSDSDLGVELCALADKVKLRAPVDQLEAWTRVILLGLRGVVDGRRFIITSDDTLGMVSQLAEVGDYICIILGCSIPVVLRPIKDGYKFVGNAYLDDYMFGEVILAAERNGYAWREFRIH